MLYANIPTNSVPPYATPGLWACEYAIEGESASLKKLCSSVEAALYWLIKQASPSTEGVKVFASSDVSYFSVTVGEMLYSVRKVSVDY